MVSRRLLMTGVLLVSVLSQTGCCCHRRHVFRVQNSCCTPARQSACGEPVNSYYRRPTIEPMPAPPLAGPGVIMQQAR
jgi:hypothetical protein